MRLGRGPISFGVGLLCFFVSHRTITAAGMTEREGKRKKKGGGGDEKRERSENASPIPRLNRFSRTFNNLT